MLRFPSYDINLLCITFFHEISATLEENPFIFKN